MTKHHQTEVLIAFLFLVDLLRGFIYFLKEHKSWINSETAAKRHHDTVGNILAVS